MKSILLKANSLSFQVNKSIYSLDVLHKCFYWYGGQFDINITECEFHEEYQVYLSPKESAQELINDVLIAKIKQDLIDFKLRDIVAKETTTIRELLIAKAFAHYEEETPQTEISDPIGFNPTNIK